MRFDRERYDERLGAWAIAWLVGSAFGTIAHFAITGRVYYFNSYPVGLGGWAALLFTRGVFLLLSRAALAKAGWGLVVLAAAIAAATAPIQAAASSGWWVEGLAIVLAGVLVFLGLPLKARRVSTFLIASAVLVAATVARLVVLRQYDLSTTVLRLE